MSKKKPMRKFHIWDKDIVYGGEYYGEAGGLPDTERWPYYLEVIPPDCPLAPCKPPEPEYPDGWYLVLSNQRSEPLARQKRGDVAYSAHGERNAEWDQYEVVASLGDVKFLDGRGEK